MLMTTRRVLAAAAFVVTALILLMAVFPVDTAMAVYGTPPPRGRSYVPLGIGVCCAVISLGGWAYRKWTGAPKTTAREDWQELKDSFAEYRQAVAAERAEREQQQQWEQQQAEQPVYDYDAYSEPTYTEPAPAPTAPAPKASNDDDGWGL